MAGRISRSNHLKPAGIPLGFAISSSGNLFNPLFIRAPEVFCAEGAGFFFVTMSNRSLSSRARWSLYGLVVLIAGGGVWYFSQPRKSTESRSSWGNLSDAVPVRVAVAAQRDLPVQLKAIGTVTPLNSVTVRSRVDGQLLRVAFQEGQRVEQGQLLAEIDPAPYISQLAQAQAQLGQNQAQLETAQADLQRFQQLYEKQLVTNQQMDTQQSLVRVRESTLAEDRARVEEAQLKLAYTRIEAPITGRVGLRRVDAGNLIRANDTNGLIVITQTQPIGVMFTIPEVNLQEVVAPLRAGEKLTVEAWDRNERNLLARGFLQTVDNQIDLATGTLRLKAQFPNEDEMLFPNQFVNIRLLVRTLPDSVVIPGAAVQYGSRGPYVYVVTAENKVVIRDIVLGPTQELDQAVVKGLVAGEAVVLEGLDRLRDGRKVMVVTDDPATDPHPTPSQKKKKKS